MSLADQQWCPSSVQVTVLQARGLRIKGKSGTNDAYAVMQVGKEKFQTSVAEKSVAPVWKEEAAFDLPPLLHGAHGSERGTLHVHVLHRALVGPDKLLGQAVINLLQLSEDKTRSKTEWFKLLDKTGKPDKDRGEVLLDIQFMRNNMTASMFDLSAAGKSRSRLGKFKDKVRGKKKESDCGSNTLPSFTQVLTDSEEEANGGEVAASKDSKNKKHKMKSLFSPKSNLQKNMSQSMSVLPGKNSTLSGSQSSGLNVDSSEGKKKFKFKIHKRSGSSDGKDSSSGLQKQLPVEQSNLCINGSHIYCEEPPSRTSRIGSNFSLASSGHGSMEEVPENSPPSVDSLRAVRQYSPWTEEEEEEVENIKEDESRRMKMEEEEKVRRQQEELERLAEEEERRRVEEQKVKREEEERIRREEEERERLAEEKRRLEEQEQRKIEEEEEKRQREEEEKIRMEEERAQEERRRRRQEEEEERVRREEEHKLAEEKRRLEEEERRRVEEEERRRREEKERAEEERRQREEEERVRKEKEEYERLMEEKRKVEDEKKRIEAEERRKMMEEERMRKEEQERKQREEEERVRKEKEEYEKLMEEKRKLEEEKERIEAEEKLRKEEEERIRMEEERMRKQEEEKRRREEQERMQREEEERIKKEELQRQEEEERVRKEMEEKRKLEDEKKRMKAEEKLRKEEEERARMEEEMRRQEEEEERVRKEKEEYERLMEEKRKLEEEKERIEAEEKLRKEEEERIRMEEERRRKEEVEKRRREEQERIRVEEEKRQREEEERRREEEERARKEKEEYERLEEERMKEEEQRRRIEEEERIRKEEQERIKMEEEERTRKEKEEMERLAEERRRKEEEEKKRIEEEEKVRREEEERMRRERKEKEEARRLEKEKLKRDAEEQKKMENKDGQKAAGKKSKLNSSADVCSTNPFDENYSYNPFEEIPDSPPGAKEANVQQRCQSAVSSLGSKIVSTDEKELVSAQREKRLAPQPPGRNQAEKPKEQDASGRHLGQISTQDKDKEVKTVSVPPQRSVQVIVPVSRSPADLKNDQSSTAKGTTGKHSKRPAPPRPRSVEEEPKTTSTAETKPTVYGLNPFEDEEDENDAGPVCWPPAADKDAASQTKTKSSKVARAPPPPQNNCTLITQNTEGGCVADDTVPDGASNKARDPQPEAVNPPQVQESPVQNTVEAHVKKEGPPVAARRLQPVKPLNSVEQQSVSVVQGENKSTGIHGEAQDKAKVNDTGLKGPFSQLTQEELISLVLKQENQLSERDKKISELEQYIDNLLVRVIEEQPSILMSMNSLKKAA